MEGAKSEPEELVKPAHRLAGTTLSMGLSRIGTLAREIEHAAMEERQVDDLLVLLQRSIPATRNELDRLGLLGASA